MFLRSLSTVLVAAVLMTLSVRGQQPRAGYADGELLVKFDDRVDAKGRDLKLQLRAIQRLNRFEHLGIEHVRLPAGQAVEQALASLGNDPDVIFAQPNFERHVVAPAPPNDPYWLSDSLWGLLAIQASQAWTAYGTGSTSVVVADIDTGVDYNHADLSANMWRNPGEVAGNGVDDDANGYVDDVFGIDTANRDSDPMDDYGHGTHTSGTMAAAGNNGIGVVGVSWNSTILACKFIASSGFGYDSGAIECFNYVVGMKQRGVNVRVTNNSWGWRRGGGGIPTGLKHAIDAVGTAGIVNVFAAGNDGTNNDAAPFDPASLTSASIIAVAASDAGDARAGFSNYGATSVDLAAPGTGIISTRGAGYASSSGTSMAAPHVAGAVALLTAINPAATVAQLKAALLNNVDQVAGWGGLVVSNGRLNVLRAATAVGGNASPTVSIDSPTSGSTFVAPATINLVATAADVGGSVANVAFYANGTLLGTDTTASYTWSWTGMATGTYDLTAVATDNVGATTTSAANTVTVTAAGTRVNVASAVNGATATASSTYSSQYAPAGAINGDRAGHNWGQGGGWNDGTAGTTPDWFEVAFSGVTTIGEVDVFTVQDAYQAPSAPTPTMVASLYGLRAFDVQYWTGSAWQMIPGATIAGNMLVWRQFTFAPVSTSRIRIWITGTADTWSRITEVEAYADAAPVDPRVNVAAASNGARVTASSTHSPNFAAAGAINGDRAGTNWGQGGGWNDGTPGASPDWLEITFSGLKTIDEVSVFMVQDNYEAPSEPTASTGANLYGLRSFEVQYWTGSSWQAVPGASVTGNTLAWRQFTFSQIATSRIRIWITSTADTWSRIVEVEAYSRL